MTFVECGVSRIGPATDCETLRNFGLLWGDAFPTEFSARSSPRSSLREEVQCWDSGQPPSWE
jgi:hypothetical protein